MFPYLLTDSAGSLKGRRQDLCHTHRSMVIHYELFLFHFDDRLSLFSAAIVRPPSSTSFVCFWIVYVVLFDIIVDFCPLIQRSRPSTEVNVPENAGERTKAIASSCDDVIFWYCEIHWCLSIVYCFQVHPNLSIAYNEHQFNKWAYVSTIDHRLPNAFGTSYSQGCRDPF